MLILFQDIVKWDITNPTPSIPNVGSDVETPNTTTPTPSIPNSGSEVDTPSTTTPTPSTPSYDDNRAPSVRAMYMQNNRVRWDDIVDIDINGSDPNWDPLS